MNDLPVDNVQTERIRLLLKEREHILAMAPEKALTRILEAPQPAALVHTFPEQDFYLLVREIGAQDALPLLALASSRQLEHILDVEIWQKDRLQPQAATYWLDLIFKADARYLVTWALKEKTEFIKWYLYKHLDMTLLEHDQDPSEIPEDFISFDQTLYFRIRSLPRGEAIGEKDVEYARLAQEFLLKLLGRIAEHDYMAYHNLLLEASSVLAAEAEEEILRQRNVRLAEKGFLPFEEAVGIYQPLEADRLTPLGAPYRESNALAEIKFAAPLYPMKLLKEGTLLEKALALIDDPAIVDRMRAELAALCNRIAVADQITVSGPKDLLMLARKVQGYLTIGLEHLAGEGAHAQMGRAAAALVNYGLVQIFRLGYGRALELKWRSRRWLQSSWFGARNRSLAFWGEQWMGVLGGVLIKRPLYYDNYQGGTLYRGFQSTADIRHTAEILTQIMAMDALLRHINPTLPDLPAGRPLTFKNLLLTGWARHWLELADMAEPIEAKRFIPFFEALFSGTVISSDAAPKKVDPGMKRSFLNWLRDRSGLSGQKVSTDLGNSLEILFNELEEEYGCVTSTDLDPRYVRHFLLK